MVSFTCNSCGESLQKNEVSRHFRIACCPPMHLTCVDCMQDYNDSTFGTHNHCIKDVVETSGSDEAKPKGDLKRRAWLGIIKYAYENLSEQSPNHRNFLKQLINYPSVPQKKQKFMNFVQKVGFKVYYATAEAVWQLLWNTRMEQERGKGNATHLENLRFKLHEGDVSTYPVMTGRRSSVTTGRNAATEQNACDNRQMLTSVSSKQEPDEDVTTSQNLKFFEKKVYPNRKTAKKRIACDNDASEVVPSKKLKTEEEVEDKKKKKKKKKFNWVEAIMLELSKAINDSSAVKDLRKKVLARYKESGGIINQSAKAKFHQILVKHPYVTVKGNTVEFLKYIPSQGIEGVKVTAEGVSVSIEKSDTAKAVVVENTLEGASISIEESDIRKADSGVTTEVLGTSN